MNKSRIFCLCNNWYYRFSGYYSCISFAQTNSDYAWGWVIIRTAVMPLSLISHRVKEDSGCIIFKSLLFPQYLISYYGINPIALLFLFLTEEILSILPVCPR